MTYSTKDLISVLNSAFFTLAIRIITLFILSRLLEPASFGVVAFSFSIQSIASIIAQVDLRDSIIRNEKLTKAHFNTSLFIAALSASLIYILLFLFSPQIELHSGVENSSAAIRLIGLCILLENLSAPCEALLVRLKYVRKISVVNTFSYTFGFSVIGIVLSYVYPSWISLVFAWLGLSAVKLAGYVYALSKIQVNHFFGSNGLHYPLKETIRELLNLSLFGTLNKLVSTLSRQIDNIIIGATLGNNLLGFYSRSYSLAKSPVDALLGLSTRLIVYPTFAGAKENVTLLKKSILVSLEIGSTFLFLTGVVLLLNSKDIIEVMLGVGWDQSIIPFGILSFALSIGYAQRFAVAIGRALNVQFNLLIFNIFLVLILTASIYIGSALLGIIGASLGVLLSSIISWVGSIFFIKTYGKLSFRDVTSSLKGSLFTSSAYAAAFFAFNKTLHGSEISPLLKFLTLNAFSLAVFIFLVPLFPRVFLSTRLIQIINTRVSNLRSNNRLKNFLIMVLKFTSR